MITMIAIPQRLKEEEFRFVKIRQGEKAPFEKAWVRENNYHYNDPSLRAHLTMDGNYGIVGGYGNLLIVDCDTQELLNLVEQYLPSTFAVQTGRGGKHFYYTCEDFGRPLRLRDVNKENVGDIQAFGKQVVGPGSVHPNGNIYQVINDSPLAKVTRPWLEVLFEPYLIKRTPTNGTSDINFNEHALSITDVVPLGGLVKYQDEYRGPHPIHDSDTGQNFSVNPSKNLWHCWRHDCGGGPLHWVAIANNIIECGEELRGSDFVEALMLVEEKYGVRLIEDEKR